MGHEQTPPLITLTTDFGTADGYVGVMKGVMLTIAPRACLVDISHEISPRDVRQAAYALYAAAPFFPSHAVHLAVVDPGVGGGRRPIALRTSAGTFVGPDNGILTYMMARGEVEALVELADPRYRLEQVCDTFHGRDIFAPAAAHLAAGVPIASLGPPLSDPVTLPLPHLEITPRAIAGEVMVVDRFGNAVTSIGRLTWCRDELVFEPAFHAATREERIRFRAAEATLSAAGREIAGLCHTYVDVEPGAVLALVGSTLHLEIAMREGHAAAQWGLRPGDPVSLRFK